MTGARAAGTAKRGWPAAILVGCVVATLLFGTGFTASRYALGDGGAWLPASEDGALVHVNGASGQVDWRITQVAGEGDRIEVVQGPEGVYLINRTTGEITPVDPVTLTTGDTVDADRSTALLLGGGDTYEVTDGQVRYLDPVTLEPLADPLSYREPITAVVDPEALLFLATADGTLVSVFEGEEQAVHDATPPDHDLTVTLAAGAPGLVDATDHVVVPVDPGSGRPGDPIELPTDGRLRVQDPSLDGERLWLTAGRTAQLLGADLASGDLIETEVPDTERAGPPRVAGDRVFVPAFDRGSLLRFDGEDGSFLDEVDVGVEPGEAFESFVKDGFVYVNQPDSDEATVVDQSGRARTIDKGAPAPSDDGQGFDALNALPPPVAGNAVPFEGPTGAAAPLPDPGPAAPVVPNDGGNPAPATTLPTGSDDGLFGPPGPPQGVTATPGPEGSDVATVSWSPPADDGGAGPLTYQVTATPSGATAQTAATSTQVSGIPFAQPQTFTVVASNEVGGGPGATSAAITVFASNGSVAATATSPGPDQVFVGLTVIPPAGESVGGCTVNVGGGPQPADCAAGFSATTGPGLITGDACATFPASSRNACGPFSVTVYSTGQVSSATQSAIHSAPDTASAIVGTMTAGAGYDVDAVCNAGGFAWLRLIGGGGWLNEYLGGAPPNLEPSCA